MKSTSFGSELMRRHPLLLAAFAAGTAILACASPLTPTTVLPAETGVALTLQALATAATPLPAATPVPSATPAPDLLPHELYFLNRDSAGLWQIYRLAVDGRTQQQITFEPLNVDMFDVSPADGSIAFTTNNQLYLVDRSGGGRRLLVDGGPIDDNNRWTNSVGSPVWSPDGRTLAFSHGGLSFMDPGSGSENRVLENQVDTSPGFPIVKELYAPSAYSPDGSKLLINIGFYEGGTYGIYVAANNSLVRFQRPEGGNICCYVDWIPDGSGVYITSPTLGMVESGLYHADAASGTVTALLPGAPPDGTYNFAYAAQVGADNRLYFFFNNLPEIPVNGHTPLYMVRSAPDGVTGRTKLLPDAFDNINEALWASDVSLAVVIIATNPDDYSGGEARLVYPDGRPSVSLTAFARDLRWGP
jgi:hypothetical protein